MRSSFESKQTKTLWTRKEREVAKRTKAEKQAVLSDEKKAAIPKAKPITDIYASVVKSKNGSEYCQVVFTVKR